MLPPSSPASEAVGSDAFLSLKALTTQTKQHQLLMESKPIPRASKAHWRTNLEAQA